MISFPPRHKRYTTFLLSAMLVISCTFEALGIDVTFEVNMALKTEQGAFSPSVNFVDIAGTFNDWDGSSHRLSDPDGDLIYSVTISGFTANDNIEFKFRIDGAWDGREEFPGGGPNRKAQISEEDNLISVWYNDEIPEGAGFIIGMNTDFNKIFSKSHVRFTNETIGEFEEVQWTFEGGQPNTSSATNPLVFYDQPGEYDVSLRVSDGTETDEIIQSNFIQVSQRDKEEEDWWNETVFYQIFVRSFKDSDGDGIGDFKGLIEQLDYLNDGDPETIDDLGIGGIWLMPIHPSPSYHGYDVTDYTSVNTDYGTMADFDEFMEEARRRGIKVIIDFVVNHTSTDHPWFQSSRADRNARERDYFIWRENKPDQRGPWGQEVWHSGETGYYYGLFWGGMPDLNYDNPEVFQIIRDAADFWLLDKKIDGFRLDAVKFIDETGDQLEDTEGTFEFWERFQRAMKFSNPQSLSVGEAWTSTDKILPYLRDNEGMDMCFEFDLAGAILNSVQTEHYGAVQRQVQNVYNVYPDQQWGTFLTNHDMNRSIDLLGNSIEQAKTAAAIYMTLPGVPFVYYGEELGMRGVKPDEFIRRPMQWTGGTNVGFTSGTPWIFPDRSEPMRNVETENSDPNSLLNWYRKLIHLRTEEPSLNRGSYRPLLSDNTSILAFERSDDQYSTFVFINLSDNKISANIDTRLVASLAENGMYTDLLTGNSQLLDIQDQTVITEMQFSPREVVILQAEVVVSDGIDIQNSKTVEVFPNPTSAQLHITWPDALERNLRYEIYSFDGQRIVQSTIEPEGTFDVSALSEGPYWILFYSGKERFIGSFVKI